MVHKGVDSFMERNDYGKIVVDHYVFVKKFNDGYFIILLIYIGEILIVGPDNKKIQNLKVKWRTWVLHNKSLAL